MTDNKLIRLMGSIIFSIIPLFLLELSYGKAQAETLQLALGPYIQILPKTSETAKIGHGLHQLFNEYKSFASIFGIDASRLFKPRNRFLKVFNGYVLIEAVAANDPDALAIDLKRLNIQNVSRFRSHISGRLPITALIQMARLKSLKFARPAYFKTNVGLTDSQGDRAVNSDEARSIFKVDGTGITVGTLSDSFNCLNQAAADIANGDLPAGIQVLDDSACPTGTDEGRAMMQLITDIAPGANQAFHTAFGGQAAFAQGIIDLASAGCNVIVDDIIYFAEPMFQDGIVAQTVDSIVDSGVTYFSSAINADRKSYESAFSSSGIQITIGGSPFGVAHDFDPGVRVDIYESICIPGNASLAVSFQWDSPYFSVSGNPGSSNDLDIFVTNDEGTLVLAGSASPNIGGDPIEVFIFTNTSAQAGNFNLLITNFSGPDPAVMKYVIFNSTISINEYDTAAGTSFGHPNAAGAEAVAAAFYGNTPEFGVTPAVVESFSSAGGVPIIFDVNGNRLPAPEVRNKPEITAPDGTNTTFFGSSDVEPDGFPNFFGTSAAAPHAAAVAALLLEKQPALLPNEVYAALEQTALDMDDPSTPGFDDGFDFATGWGLIQADRALSRGFFYVEQNSVCGGKTPCFSNIQSAINSAPTGETV
jgi:subtilisin family serine protease